MCCFSGTVTLDGNPVDAGTTITAKADGTEVGTADATTITLANVDSTMPLDLLIWHYGGPIDGWQFYKKGWGALNTLATLVPDDGYIGIVPTASIWAIPQG